MRIIFFPLAISVFLNSSLHSLAFGPPVDLPRELAKAIREQEALVNESRGKLDAIIAERLAAQEFTPPMGGQQRHELRPVEFWPQEAQIPQNQRAAISINLCLLCLLWPFPHEVSQELAPPMGGQRRDELQPVEFWPQEAQISQNQRVTIPINLCLLCLLWPFPHEVSGEFVEAKKRYEIDKALLTQMRTKLVDFLLEEEN